MTENTVLPLINTAFEPGNARKAAESFADRDFREIAEHIGILKHSEALSYRYL